MKKVLPLLLFALLALASCHREPAIYQFSESPEEMAENAEKFAAQTMKRSAHYTAEDWEFTVEQFVAMTKDYVEKKDLMSPEDVFRADSARLVFTDAVAKNGGEKLVLQTKELFHNICD